MISEYTINANNKVTLSNWAAPEPRIQTIVGPVGVGRGRFRVGPGLARVGFGPGLAKHWLGISETH